jgi:putative transposase
LRSGIAVRFAVAVAIDTGTLGCEMLGEGCSQLREGVFRGVEQDPEHEVLEWVKKIAEASDYTYGFRRMAKALQALGDPVGRHQVLSLMRGAGE